MIAILGDALTYMSFNLSNSHFCLSLGLYSFKGLKSRIRDLFNESSFLKFLPVIVLEVYSFFEGYKPLLNLKKWEMYVFVSVYFEKVNSTGVFLHWSHTQSFHSFLTYFSHEFSNKMYLLELFCFCA